MIDEIFAQLAQLADEVRQLPDQVRATVLYFVEVASTKSTGEGAAQVADGERRYQRPITLVAPFGIKSRPPAGVRGLILQLLDATGMLVGVEQNAYGPNDGEDGELILHSTGDAVIRIKPSGDVVITPAAGKKVIVAGGGKKAARKGDAVKAGTLYFQPGTGGATLTYVPPGGPAGTGTPIPLSNLVIDGGSGSTEIGD